MRFLTLLLTLLLVFSLVACGGSEESSTPAFSNANSAPKEESKVSSSAVESSVAESSAVDSSVVESSAVDSSAESSDESSEEEVEPFEPIEYDDYEIKKAPGAVEVDGIISDGEYETVFEFDADELIWSAGSDEKAAEYEPKLYISWDKDFLYTAVSLGSGKPRTYNNTDYLTVRPYIFDRRHVMSAVMLGDPTDPKYIPPVGNAWDWADAYSTGYASEWTNSAQPDGALICADHFGEVTINAGYKYEIKLGGFDNEIYEQRIPWAAIAGGIGYEAKAGNVIGYAFSAACEEVQLPPEGQEEDFEDENAVYAGFGAGINNGKNFAHYVGLTLAE